MYLKGKVLYLTHTNTHYVLKKPLKLLYFHSTKLTPIYLKIFI